MKSNLPAGWTLAKVKDIANINMGQSPPSTTYNDTGTGLPFFQGKAEFGKVYPTVRKYCSEPNKIAQPNDILISVRAPVGPTNLCQQTSCIGRGLAAIRANAATSTPFLLYFFKYVEPWLSTQGSGSTFTAVNKETLNELDFPLPPINEQRRIIAQFEAVMQKLEASQERLEKLPVLLKKFRQAVLAAAVSGRLTQAWRAQHSQGETGTDVLDRIRAKRRTQWEYKQRAKLSGKQLSLGDNWRQKYEEPTALDTSELPDLEDGWAWCQLDNVAEMCLGKMLDGAKNQGSLQPYMGNINVRWGSFNLEEAKMMRFTDEEEERYSVKKGDLVVCEGGEPGRAAIWEADSSIKIQKALHRVRPDNQFLLSHFLYYNLRLDAVTHRLDSYFTGTGIQHFTGKALARYTFPLPPLEEQQEIVRQVNHYFALADQLEARFDQAAAMVEQLPQALLAKAFSGQLVPQDPNDEPASALLERLHAQPAAPAKGNGGRQPKTAAPLFE